jgi:hypothetical protein
MNLVRESISFERGLNPKKALGIGEKGFIEKWLKYYGIKNYRINDDLSIDVTGNVIFDHGGISEFPNYIQFHIVLGSFNCSGADLISLRGCPMVVTGSFNCGDNDLTSLKYAPKRVGGQFNCYNNARKFKYTEVTDVCKVEGNIYV